MIGAVPLVNVRDRDLVKREDLLDPAALNTATLGLIVRVRSTKRVSDRDGVIVGSVNLVLGLGQGCTLNVCPIAYTFNALVSV